MPKNICGAKAKSTGEPCQKSPVKGKKRCRLHGGLSPGGKKENKNSSKHGIYESGLSEDEKKLYLSIKLGDFQHETRMCRILLRRALIAKKTYEEERREPPLVEKWAENKVEEDGTIKQTRIKKHPLYYTIIDRYLGRIAKLEKTQLEITGGLPERPSEVASEFFEALKEVERMDGAT